MSVTSVWFAETVLHGVAVLAPVERLKSRSIWAIESGAVPATSTIAVPIPITVERAIVVPVTAAIIAIAARPITA